MRTLYTAALCVASLTVPAEAANLYSEDFSNQENHGIIGNGSGITPSGWTVGQGGADIGAAGSSNDFAAVKGGVFTFQDLNFGCPTSGCVEVDLPAGTGPNGIGYTLWQSPLIDPTSFLDLSLGLDWTSKNTDFPNRDWTSGEDLLVGIRDEGTGAFTVLFDYLQERGTARGIASGSLDKAFAATSVFRVFVAAAVDDSGNITYGFDNVSVMGEASGGGGGGGGSGGDGGTVITTPVPASALLLVGALIGLGACRRRVCAQSSPQA